MEQSSNTKEKIKKENEELKQKLKEQLVSLDDVSKSNHFFNIGTLTFLFFFQ